VNKLISTAMAIGLVFAAASCSSDKASPSTTAGDTAVTADSTAGSTDGTTGSSTDISLSGTLDEQALAITVAGVEAVGATVDKPCLAAVIAQLSDEDKQLIIDGGVGGTVTLSTEGEKLGETAQACVVFPETETTS
jgi:hypothetical protein